MYWRAPVNVTVSMKSIARTASAWARRTSAHVAVVRLKAGSHSGMSAMTTSSNAERRIYAAFSRCGRQEQRM